MKKRIMVYLLLLISGLLYFNSQSERLLAAMLFRSSIRLSSTRILQKNRVCIRDDGAMMARSDTAGETVLLDRIDESGQLVPYKRLPFRFHQGLGYEENEIDWGENGPFLTTCSEKQIMVLDSQTGRHQILTGDDLFHSAFFDIHTFTAAYISGDGRWLIVDAVGEKGLFESKDGQYKPFRRLDDQKIFLDFIFSPDGSFYLEKGSDRIVLRRTLDGKAICDDAHLFGSDTRYTQSTNFTFSKIRNRLYAVKDSGIKNRIVVYDFDSPKPRILSESHNSGARVMEWQNGLIWNRWRGFFDFIPLSSDKTRHSYRLDLDPALRGRDSLNKAQFYLNEDGSRLLLVDYDNHDPHQALFETYDAHKLPLYDQKAFARISGEQASVILAGGMLVLFLIIEGLLAILAHFRPVQAPTSRRKT